MPDVISLGEVKITRGIGYLDVTLVADGNTAYEKLKALAQETAAYESVASIDFYVKLEVQDKSSAGRKAEFEILFTIASE